MSAAVLLLAHGTPDSLTQMPEYLARVRGGRPPSPELIEEMTRNYAAIGGRSPLTEITLAQGEALAAACGRPVYVAMRNWHPLVPDVLARAARQGASRLLVIPLAPQYSTLSVAKYREAVESARAAELGLQFVESWHEHPLLLDAFAEKLSARLDPRPDAVVFTAHSLPQRVIEAGDPYARQVEGTAAGVAQRVGLGSWRLAYQSAGRTPEPWLGPTVEAMLTTVAGDGARRVVVCPIGFVCDHTEILFDIDVQAAGHARGLGLELVRTESLNTSPTFVRALADLVGQALG
jgi:ferrochelatase